MFLSPRPQILDGADFCGLRRRRWLGIRQGSQQIARQVGRVTFGDGAQNLAKKRARAPVCWISPDPEVFGEFSDGVVGKGTQVQRRQHGGEVLRVTEIVLEVVSLGFQDIEAFVFYLPPGAAGGGEFDDVIAVDR